MIFTSSALTRSINRLWGTPVKDYFLLSLNGDRHVVLRAIIQVSLDLVVVADTVAAVGLQVEDPLHVDGIVAKVDAVISALARVVDRWIIGRHDA
jgi:hypothetical protein